MNNPPLVRGSQPFRNLLEQRQGLLHRNRAGGDALRESLPFHQLHHQKLLTVRFFEPVERGDKRVIQRGEEPGLTFEPGDPVFILGELLRKNLDRDFSTQLGVLGPVNFTHSPYPDRSKDLVETQVNAGAESHQRNVAV